MNVQSPNLDSSRPFEMFSFYISCWGLCEITQPYPSCEDKKHASIPIWTRLLQDLGHIDLLRFGATNYWHGQIWANRCVKASMIQWDVYLFHRRSPQKNTTEMLGPRGGFLKWWYPTTMGFPTKNDHFGVFWGYHNLRKHPSVGEAK